jgi:uncharacterized membrane protein YagU involved in acid resistance
MTKTVTNGVIAGLGGGAVFGIMMGMMDMLPMVGMLVGQANAVIGFGVHMAISAVIGAIYGVVMSRVAGAPAWLAGLINGVVWWVLGALILMPLMLGMSEMVFSVSGPQMMSLAGHVLFGLVTAYLFAFLARR